MRSTDVNIIMLHDILTLHTALITLNYCTVPNGNKLQCFSMKYFQATADTKVAMLQIRLLYVFHSKVMSKHLGLLSSSLTHSPNTETLWGQSTLGHDATHFMWNSQWPQYVVKVSDYSCCKYLQPDTRSDENKATHSALVLYDGI